MLYDKILDVLMVLIFACLCLLAWSSVFIWHDMFCAFMFTAAILVWLWGEEAASNND